VSWDVSKVFDQFDKSIATKLDAVKMWAHPDLPNGIGLIELSFESGQVFISIEDEFDTLNCSRARSESQASYTLSISSPFWDPVVGKFLIGAWKMTSDRGYPDGIQLRFRDSTNAGPGTIIQLYGEASQITLTDLKEVRRASMSKTT
jgi:hypothetical protein